MDDKRTILVDGEFAGAVNRGPTICAPARYAVIDGYLTEINVTSPTDIRAIKRLGGPNIAARRSGTASR